jgi:hypothetical protein
LFASQRYALLFTPRLLPPAELSVVLGGQSICRRLPFCRGDRPGGGRPAPVSLRHSVGSRNRALAPRARAARDLFPGPRAPVGAGFAGTVLATSARWENILAALAPPGWCRPLPSCRWQPTAGGHRRPDGQTRLMEGRP